MTEHNNIQDDFLKKLIRKSDIDRPGSNFTEGIMNKIRAEQGLGPVSSQPILSKKMWLLIGFAVIVLIITVFYLDFSFLGNLFKNLGTDKGVMLGFFESMVNSFNQLFGGIKITSISIIIILSILSLIGVDLLFKKPRTTNTFTI